MPDNNAKLLAKMLVESDPEYANDLYFALEDNFLKKPAWHTELTQVVNNWVNPPKEIVGYATIEDANDGSGDAILTFPEGFCEKNGWKEGDTLNLEVNDAGSIVISKIS